MNFYRHCGINFLCFFFIFLFASSIRDNSSMLLVFELVKFIKYELMFPIFLRIIIPSSANFLSIFNAPLGARLHLLAISLIEYSSPNENSKVLITFFSFLVSIYYTPLLYNNTLEVYKPFLIL